MSVAQIKHAWIVVLLVMTWAFMSDGAVKPRDPKSAAAPQKSAQPAPQSTVQPPKVDGPKTVANPRPAQVVLENPATFTPDMTFGRAIEILRHCVNPPVNIVVLWRDVEEKAGITRETPIGLDGLPGLRVRQYLDLLLRSVSAGADAELGFCLDGGVVLVATKDSLPKPKFETRVYDISDLVAPPSFGIMMLPMISPFGNSMQPYGNYGTGTQNNRYSPGTGYNSAGNSQQSSRTQNGTPGRVVLYGS
jgi:hypothetical protein